MTLSDALALGRVSNLPTVWTNVLTGVVLAGGALADGRTALLLLALTLFYVGGMFLNDAFDAGIDARERPERPIPAGRVTRAAVFEWGFGMLSTGVVLVHLAMAATGKPGWAGVAALALGAAIVLYDRHHKANPWSPVVMGVCRMLVYACAALVFAPALPGAVLAAAVVVLCYLIGLTYVAKQENLGEVRNLWPLAFLAVPVAWGAWLAGSAPWTWLFWLALVGWVAVALRFVRRRGPGDIPRAVVSLIAGISLVDALLLAGAGAIGVALVALLAFALTLALQRLVSGT